MKTLLILLFIPVLGFSQFDPINLDTWPEKEASNEKILDFGLSTGTLASDTLTIIDFERVVMLHLIDKWSQYEEECYNDSTFYKQNYGCLDSATIYHDSRLYRYRYSHIIKEEDCYYLGNWISKQPTFTGFMNWIRKKYNYE